MGRLGDALIGPDANRAMFFQSLSPEKKLDMLGIEPKTSCNHKNAKQARYHCATCPKTHLPKPKKNKSYY